MGGTLGLNHSYIIKEELKKLRKKDLEWHITNTVLGVVAIIISLIAIFSR